MSIRIDVSGTEGAGKTRLTEWLAANLPAWAGNVDIIDDPAGYCHVTQRPAPVGPLTQGDGRVGYKPQGTGQGQRERKLEIARNLLLMTDLVIEELWQNREDNEHAIGAMVTGRIVGPISFTITFPQGMSTVEGFEDMDFNLRLGHLAHPRED